MGDLPHGILMIMWELNEQLHVIWGLIKKFQYFLFFLDTCIS